jgi:hypothetical protein
MRLRAFGSTRPRRGETISGDAYLISYGEAPLIVVADGLGHGEHAAIAAQGMVAVASEAAPADSPLDILQKASGRLAATRGAVAMVARFTADNSRLCVAGVGNIELRALSQASIHPISSPGILGRRIRSIRQFEYDLHPGDLLVFFSDGISRRLDLQPLRSLSLEEVVLGALSEHGQQHDDATCLAARVD